MDARNRDEHLRTIGRLDAVFERNRIDYWVFGGWAVDFHAGRVTRHHADIDIAIWRTDAAVVHDLLIADGFVHTPGSQDDGYTTYARDRVHVDLAFLARDDRDRVFTPLGSGRGEWPPDSFGPDIRELAGTRAHVVSISSLVEDKSQPREDPEIAAKDAADIAVLQEIR